MRTKNCQLILDYVLSLDESEQLHSHRFLNLSEHTGLSFEQVLVACKELERDSFAEIKYHHLRNGQVMPEAIVLTELGLNYKRHIREQWLSYVTDKWIDFLALIIALVALLKSYETELSALFQHFAD